MMSPRVPNKVLIDDLHFDANVYAMSKAFEASKVIDDELIELGEKLKPGSGGVIGNVLLKADADAHLPEQESICKELHEFMAKIEKRQWALAETRRKWLDLELDKLP